jgi:hypothetical protein
MLLDTLLPECTIICLCDNWARKTKEREYTMAKREGVSKTKAVLDYWREHPEAKAKAIAEALTKAGTPITAGYVANIKSKHKKQRRAVKAVVEERGVSVSEIKAAMNLLKVCETPAAAKEALSAAEEIRRMM